MFQLLVKISTRVKKLCAIRFMHVALFNYEKINYDQLDLHMWFNNIMKSINYLTH